MGGEGGKKCRAENLIPTSPVGRCSEPALGMALNAQERLCFPNLVLAWDSPAEVNPIKEKEEFGALLVPPTLLLGVSWN